METTNQCTATHGTATQIAARVCCVCGATFNAPGALCATHRAQLADYAREQAAKSDAITDARIYKAQAARRARGRTEWVEAV